MNPPREPEDNEVGVGDCTCRLSSINSASIEPPHRIVNPWCPVHGGRDADAEYDAKRDEPAEPFWNCDGEEEW